MYKTRHIIFLAVIIFSLVIIIMFTRFQQIFTGHASYRHTQMQTGNLASWPMFDGDPQKSGNNSQEATLTKQNVSQLQQFWQVTLPTTADSAPVYQPNVVTANGTYNMVFINTKAGSLIAYDADSGTKLWEADHKRINITTSSPAIDPSGQFIYNYALDGKVHQYTIGTGVETINNIFPATVTLNPEVNKGASSLTIANGYLYVTTSAYPWLEGNPNFHDNGHIAAVNLTTGTVSVFNTECSNLHELLTSTSGSANYCPNGLGGIWGRAGVIVDPQTQNIFAATANGLYDANNGGVNYADTIVELSPDLSHIIDTYTPSNYATLQLNDLDLGITAPVLIPLQSKSNTPSMLAVGGKDKVIRLINKVNMSGQGGPNHVGGELQTVSLQNGCIMFPQPLAWNDATGQTWVFAAYGCNFYAYKVVTVNGVSSLQLAYQNATFGGSSPIIANNMLFIEGKTAINIIDPTTGTLLASLPNPGGIHWQSPIVINGRIYTADNAKHLTAYALPSQLPTLSPTLPVTPSATPPMTPTTSLSPTPTPTKVTITDTFQRPDQSPWGTATDGNIWTGSPNNASVFSILNNSGTITGTGYYDELIGPAIPDAVITAEGTITSYNLGNFGVVLRYTNAKNWYDAHLTANRLYILKSVNGTTGIIASAPYPSTPNVVYTIKFQVQGTTLSAKVWQSGDPEPQSWTASGTDSALTNGQGGIRVRIDNSVAAYTSFLLQQL